VTVTSGFPRVSVLVLNFNGRQYLEACLSSLDAQSYPRDRFEIVVVDNGSTDDSMAFVRERYPRARTVQFDGNHGFCAPYNVAIRSCESDFVALLNNDARVDPQWLVELIVAADRHRAAAVASRILDWNGQRVDFAGGVLSFLGHSWQVDFGEPSSKVCREGPLLFPCGASALFDRAVFLDAGGFDEDFFAYFEDVDLGWRLNLFGHTVVLAPAAVTYHRLYGTSSRWAAAQRVRLFERNALAMIYKNYEAETLARILPAAVALSLMRGLMLSGLDRLDLSLSSQPPEAFGAGWQLVPHLIALEDFCGLLAPLRRKRELVQSRRRRSDRDLLHLFGEPFRLHESGGAYEEVARTLISDFGIDRIFVPRAEHSRASTEHSRASAEHTGESTERPRASAEHSEPKVSIVILTALGATHLPECLDSLRAQTYPPDRVEVVVVDNGSADDPTREAERGYPGARVIRASTNLGFAAGNNLGADAATGDYLIFLNDDTRAAPDWLRELVETAQRRRAAAVASTILDWSGRSIDFVDGAVSFQGKGFQLHYNVPADKVTREEKPLLFACGCAMLIDRAVFLDAGRWDEGAFAYYEDVELGWRLNLLGHEVWLAPHAVVYHKHHGTSGRWPEPPRTRLYERNSLRLLYALLEDTALERVLPAALLLAADRALLGTRLSRVEGLARRPLWKHLAGSIKVLLRARGISRATPIGEAIRRLGVRGFLRIGHQVLVAPPGESSRPRRAAYLMEQGEIPATFDTQFESLPIHAAAMLAGIYGFLSELPALSRRRADIQRRRHVTDRELLARFGTHWLAPTPAAHQAEHDVLHAALVDELGLTGT
jgi:GT2 family glycosyltransferase